MFPFLLESASSLEIWVRLEWVVAAAAVQARGHHYRTTTMPPQDFSIQGERPTLKSLAEIQRKQTLATANSHGLAPDKEHSGYGMLPPLGRWSAAGVAPKASAVRRQKCYVSWISDVARRFGSDLPRVLEKARQ